MMRREIYIGPLTIFVALAKYEYSNAPTRRNINLTISWQRRS